MSRTFSLARLMIGVTVLCIVCGLAVSFPQLLLLCTPTVIVCLGLVSFSHRRAVVLVVALTGAFAILPISPAISFELFGYPHDRWERYQANAMLPALAAFLFGSAALLHECLPWRNE
jgi:hypothetical protein